MESLIEMAEVFLFACTIYVLAASWKLFWSDDD